MKNLRDRLGTNNKDHSLDLKNEDKSRSLDFGENRDLDMDLLEEMLDQMFDEGPANYVQNQVELEFSEELVNLTTKLADLPDEERNLCMNCISNECEHIKSMEQYKIDLMSISCEHEVKHLDICLECLKDRINHSRDLQAKNRNIRTIITTFEIAEYHDFRTRGNLEFGFLN